MHILKSEKQREEQKTKINGEINLKNKEAEESLRDAYPNFTVPKDESSKRDQFEAQRNSRICITYSPQFGYIRPKQE